MIETAKKMIKIAKIMEIAKNEWNWRQILKFQKNGIIKVIW